MRDNQKGFTLLELLVTISIFSMVIGYFTIFFSNEIKLYYSKDNDIELKQDARIAMDRIVSKIRSKNNLSYLMNLDETIATISDQDGNVIINTTPNDPDPQRAEIHYTFSDVLGYGELLDEDENKIVGNISEFILTKQDFKDHILINITISCTNTRAESIKQYSTAVRVYNY